MLTETPMSAKKEKIMAKVDLTMDLNLKAYPNDLTPDVDSDYVVKVDTQTTSLTLDDLAEMPPPASAARRPWPVAWRRY